MTRDYRDIVVDPLAASLRPADLAMFAAISVTREFVTAAQIRRVTAREARELYGITAKSNALDGIVYPYFNVTTGDRVTCRLRRDHPELGADREPENKYLAPFGDPRALFFPPGASALVTDSRVIVVAVEAEKSALALTAAAARCGRRLLAFATGGCWGWKGTIGKTMDAEGARVDVRGPLPDFNRVDWRDRDIVILFDANAAMNSKVQAARRALAAELIGRGAKVRIANLPTAAGVNGPDDYIGTHGDAALFALIDGAKPIERVSTTRSKPEKPKQGRDVQLEDPEPWPEPVDGAELLDAMAATFKRYLALPTHAGTALALWVLHAYAFEAWFTSPFLAITSPVKRCGKTLLLIVLGALVPRRLFASNVTPAVLFRTIEKYRPSLLIDEADTFVRENDELRGVLNSGHTRTTAVVIRAVGDDHDPRAFSTWCAKAIALIGKLPDTLADRAIEIAMRRRTAGERIERLRQDRIEAECAQYRRQAARWAADHLAPLQNSDPIVPVELHDRAADCWRPLLALADHAGASWPALAREAAKMLSGVIDDADQPVAVLLLGDARTIFAGRQELSSADLVKALQALDSRPWATWGKENKGLTSNALARLLRDFGIHPGKIRFGADTLNSYTRRMFEDAWTRYTPLQLEHRNNSNNDGPEPSFLQLEHQESCSGLESAVSTNNGGSCSSVPVVEGEKTEDTWLDL